VARFVGGTSIRSTSRQGDPACQIPCPIREGRVPGSAVRGCLAYGTPRNSIVRWRSCSSGPSRAGPTATGPGVGLDLARGGDRPAGTDGDPRHLRAFAGLESEVLVHGAIDGWSCGTAFVGGTCPPRGGLVVERRRRGRRIGVATQTSMTLKPAGFGAGPCAAPRPVKWKTTPPSSTQVGRVRPFVPPTSRGAADVQSFAHIPVLRDEVVSSFARSRPAWWSMPPWAGRTQRGAPDGLPGLRIIGLDRDPVALEAAAARLAPFGERVTLVHAPFSASARKPQDRSRVCCSIWA